MFHLTCAETITLEAWRHSKGFYENLGVKFAGWRISRLEKKDRRIKTNPEIDIRADEMEGDIREGEVEGDMREEVKVMERAEENNFTGDKDLISNLQESSCDIPSYTFQNGLVNW